MLKIKEIFSKLIPKKDNFVPLVISVIITSVFFYTYYLLGNKFGEVMGIITIILLALMMAVIAMLAGYLVMKSLVIVSAELSLLIFLAQSYCDSSIHTIASSTALNNLLTIGFVYIVFNFIYSLYKALKEYYKNFENKKWSKEKVLIITFFLIYTFMFIWQIYLVIEPIVLDLCIYKKI